MAGMLPIPDKGTRDTLFFLLIFISGGINAWLSWWSWGGWLVFLALCMIIIKLTDVEDAIITIEWNK